jgi:hypothetical protein
MGMVSRIMNQKMSNANVQGISRTVVDPVTKKTVMSVTFLRENGLLVVKAKSDLFASYFKNQSLMNAEYGSNGNDWYPKRAGFKIPSEYAFHKFNDDDIQISLRYWGETDLFFNNHSNGDGDVPNIAWVRSRELAKGIKIPVHGSPMDGKKFTKYCDQTMKYLGDMYNKYMTPKQSKGKITIKSEHIR